MDENLTSNRWEFEFLIVCCISLRATIADVMTKGKSRLSRIFYNSEVSTISLIFNVVNSIQVF